MCLALAMAECQRAFDCSAFGTRGGRVPTRSLRRLRLGPAQAPGEARPIRRQMSDSRAFAVLLGAAVLVASLFAPWFADRLQRRRPRRDHAADRPAARRLRRVRARPALRAARPDRRRRLGGFERTDIVLLGCALARRLRGAARALRRRLAGRRRGRGHDRAGDGRPARPGRRAHHAAVGRVAGARGRARRSSSRGRLGARGEAARRRPRPRRDGAGLPPPAPTASPATVWPPV